jgi:cytochrome c
MNKKVLLSLIMVAGLAFGTISCNKEKKAADDAIEATKEAADKTVNEVKDGAEVVKDGAEKIVDEAAKKLQISKGKALFTSKTCTACHGIDKKILGPSVQDIVKVYDEKGANMVKFLKGNAPAIVDTNPGQVAIMKANIDGFLKEVTAEELQALTAYMRSAAK